jgi:type IV fimbrial biogenesis protein FimT
MSRTRLRSPAASDGFTLVELVVVMAIVSILLALAAPNFSSFSSSQRLRAVASDLLTTLVTARSEAIKRNAQVTVSAVVVGGSSNWGRGWTATGPGGVQIDRKDIDAGQVAGPTTPATIVFDGSGRITAAGEVSLQFSDGRGDAVVAPRCVTIDLAGRPHSRAGACS